MFRRGRRRTRRAGAGWQGRYVAVGSPGAGWSSCRVLDVSKRGTGLELLGPAVEVGERVVLDLHLVRNTTAQVTLTGEVRHSGRGPFGTRVGVAFLDVGELEQALLDRLVARRRLERRHPGVVTPLAPLRSLD